MIEKKRFLRIKMTTNNLVEQKVLQVLAQIQPASIKEICNKTQMSKTTVYDSLTRLEHKKLIIKRFEDQKKIGRRSAIYELLLGKVTSEKQIPRESVEEPVKTSRKIAKRTEGKQLKKQQVLSFIQQNPGTTREEIVKELNFPSSTVSKYIDELNINSQVFRKEVQGGKGSHLLTYYSTEEGMIHLESILQNQLKERTQLILDFLRDRGEEGACLRSITVITGLKKRNTQNHLELLEINHQVDCISVGEDIHYYYLPEFTNIAEERNINETITFLEKFKERGASLQKICSNVSYESVLVPYYILKLQEEGAIVQIVRNEKTKTVLTRYKDRALAAITVQEKLMENKNFREQTCPICHQDGFLNIYCAEFYCEKCKKTSIIGLIYKKEQKKVKLNKSKSSAIENAFRIRIYEFIIRNPGLFLITIADHFDTAPSTLSQHLLILEQENFVRSFRFLGKKIFYPYVLSSEDIERIYVSLQHPKARAILRFIFDHPASKPTQIIKNFESKMHKSTVYDHINKLMEAGLIQNQEKGSNQQIFVTEIAIILKDGPLVKFTDSFVEFLTIKMQQQQIELKILIRTKKHFMIELKHPLRSEFILNLQIDDSFLNEIRETKKVSRVDQIGRSGRTKLVLTKYKDQALAAITEQRKLMENKNFREQACPICHQDGFLNIYCAEFYCEKCKKTSVIGLIYKKEQEKVKSKLSTIENAFRIKLYEFIIRNPGLSLSVIAEHFNRPQTTLTWHLQMLERENFIRSCRLLGKRIFYAYVLSSEEYERIYVSLQHPKARAILRFILDNPTSNQTQLIQYIKPKITKDTAHFHIKKLLKAGLIRSQKKGRNQEMFASELAIQLREGPLVDFSDSFVEFLTIKMQQLQIKLKILIHTTNQLKIEFKRPFHSKLILNLEIDESFLNEIRN